MARKLDQPEAAPAAPASAPAAPADGADDLAVLYPDATLTLAGRAITVREYGFIAGLQLRAQMAPFIRDLEATFAAGDGYTDDVLAVVGQHAELVRAAIAQSAGVEPEWIDTLHGADAEVLQLTWWAVCGPFFVRQLLRRAQEKAQRRQLLSGGDAYSPSSSTAASAASPSSDAAPSGSSGSTTVN